MRRISRNGVSMVSLKYETAISWNNAGRYMVVITLDIKIMKLVYLKKICAQLLSISRTIKTQ